MQSTCLFCWILTFCTMSCICFLHLLDDGVESHRKHCCQESSTEMHVLLIVRPTSSICIDYRVKENQNTFELQDGKMQNWVEISWIQYSTFWLFEPSQLSNLICLPFLSKHILLFFLDRIRPLLTAVSNLFYHSDQCEYQIPLSSCYEYILYTRTFRYSSLATCTAITWS